VQYYLSSENLIGYQRTKSVIGNTICSWDYHWNVTFHWKAAIEMTAPIPISCNTGLLPTKIKGHINLALLQSQPLLTPHQRLVTSSTLRNGRGWYVICMLNGHLPPMLPSNIPSPTLLLWALGCQRTMKPFFYHLVPWYVTPWVISQPSQRVSSGNLLVTNYLTEYLVLRCLLWWPTIKWELVISWLGHQQDILWSDCCVNSCRGPLIHNIP